MFWLRSLGIEPGAYRMCAIERRGNDGFKSPTRVSKEKTKG